MPVGLLRGAARNGEREGLVVLRTDARHVHIMVCPLQDKPHGHDADLLLHPGTSGLPPVAGWGTAPLAPALLCGHGPGDADEGPGGGCPARWDRRLHLAFTRRWRSLPRLFSPLAIALYFAITVPWFWAVCRANADFFDFFFIREHFLRYLTTVHDRYEPVWFFIPIILAAFVPWTGMLWDAARAAFGKCALISRDDGIFLGLWAALPFVFFSLSSSKLIPYILPCMPPAAVLIGAAMETADRRSVLCFIGLNAIILLPLALTGFLWPLLSTDLRVMSMISPALMLSAGLLAFWGTSFLLLRGADWARALLCLLGLLILFAVSPAFRIEANMLSRRDIAACVPEGAEDVVVYQSLMQGMPFYLGRRVVTADILNELSFGAEQESDPRWFISKEQLHRLWASPRRVLVVVEDEDRDSLEQTLGKKPVRTWKAAGDVLFANF